ncbi:hypothetical protein [Saccharopolyspora pogona]|uniref:hypothetical protein n=1 Tax=Saccharopolyspora pogona TaxID=333966 RepID=UPI0016867FCB|nr:hypothetical protein [Saccharopolyspora pogona]
MTEAEVAERQKQHFAEQHPEKPLSGRVEFREKKNDGVGCLAVVAILLLVLAIAAICRARPGEPVRPPRSIGVQAVFDG